MQCDELLLIAANRRNLSGQMYLRRLPVDPLVLWEGVIVSGSRVTELALGALTGNIPTELGNLSNLYDLRLASNPLSGCIPNALTRVTHNDLAELRLLLCDATPTPTALPIATPTLSPDVSIFLPLVRR